MKIEELRKIADTSPANLCIIVCRSHFEALIEIAATAKEVIRKCAGYPDSSVLDDMEKALDKLEAVK